VLDGDGVAGNYNLDGGDQPALRGSETAFWVMNDAGNTHDETESPPIGLEIEVEAFAPSGSALREATIYKYRLRYRGAEPLDSAYVTLFTDPDLGNASDDYVGSDTLREMGFVYNADNFDDNHYGANPPALGFVVAQGPVGLPNGRDDDGDGDVDEAGERLGMTASTYGIGGGPPELTDPGVAEEYYNVMQGLAPNGNPIRAFSYGATGQGDPTVFAFPGDPVTGEFWSEVNADGNGTANQPGDRRLVISTGPFRLEPGQEETVVFAVVYGRLGDPNVPVANVHLNSVGLLRHPAFLIRSVYDELGGFEPEPVVPDDFVPSEPEWPSRYTLEGPFPNPFRGGAALRLGVPEAAARVHLALYDVLGREVAVYVDGVPAPGSYAFKVKGDGLAPGVYFLRLRAAEQTHTVRITHLG
jgi:hypothetical protein